MDGSSEQHRRDEESGGGVNIPQVIDSNDKKKLRVDEESSGGVDRISDLPDAVLGQILSYLSTKNAVATNILSTRWKNLFPFEVSPIYLAFDDSDFIVHPVQNESHCNASFVSFMDKLFSQTLSYNPLVKCMLLYCHNFHGDAKIASWIDAALRLNVRMLFLQFCSGEDALSLFTCLNGYTKLVHLSLHINEDFRAPDNFTLPNLESLELSRLNFDDFHCDSIQKLLDGCPVLKDLALIGCSIVCLVHDMTIRSTALRRLTIKDSVDLALYSLVLDAPNLQLLYLSCFAARQYILSSFKNLEVAHIDIGPLKEHRDDAEDFYNMYPDADDDTWFVDFGTAKLLTACSGTKCLHLSARAIDALHNSSVQMPSFHNLTRLLLGSLGSHGWVLLAHLLNNAPFLREVYFEEGLLHENEGSYDDFEHLVPTPPTCLETHLRRVEFLVFDWSDDEIKLFLYFLMRGKALQMVRLCCHPALSKIRLDSLPYPKVKVVVESR